MFFITLNKIFLLTYSLFDLIRIKRIAVTAILLLLASVSQDCYAQINTDSIRARQRYDAEIRKKDSIIAAARKQRTQDSLNREIAKQKRIEYRDSLKQAMIERRKQDSLKREQVKQQLLAERKKQDSIRQANRLKLEKQIAQRKKTADSLRIVRKARTDSIARVRAEARRVREALKKYRNSKRYKDSVALVRQIRRDSIKEVRDKKLAKVKAERQRRIDSTKQARTEQITKLKAERKRVMDSTIAARKAIIDSMKEARKKQTEALKLARQKRKDSLEKVRGATKKIAKKKKSETELLKEQADKIHARKKGSWTNEKLLKKSWNIKRRIWQNTVTRYNSYYNAERKFKDATTLLKDRHKETYTEQLSLYPYDLESGLTAIGGDMDTVVKKCAYDTHIHDPRSKWFDNLYLLMGKAFFFKNDYESAITALKYVVNEYKDGDAKKKQKRGYKKLPELNEIKFDKDNKVRIATEEKRTGLKMLAHHSVRNEALLWLGRAYAKNGQFGDAQSLFTILEEDKIFPDRLRDDLYIAKAELEMEQGNNLSAIEPLEKALKQKSIEKDSRNRISFLLAQLYSQDGNIAKSNQFLNEALKNKLPIEMEFYTKLNLAQNAILGKGNKKAAIANLKSLAKEDKYEKWRAQSFLSLGKILQDDNPEEALKSYNSCLKTKNNKKEQAAAYLGKGEIYYKQSNFPKAKIAYDSAVAFSKNAQPQLEDMVNINLRKDVLASLIKYTDVIKVEDSLQTLSKKSEKEKISTIKKELRRLAKLERERLKKESAKLTAVTLTPGKFNKNAWYFYNNTSIQQGLLEFKNKWGDRKLEDNWRRGKNDGILAGGNLGSDGASATNSKEDVRKSAEVKKMLSALYSSPSDFKKSDAKIIDAYFQLGIIYSSRLQEHKKSIQTFEGMNRRFPNHDQLAATLYSMMLSYQKLNQPQKANALMARIRKEYPETKFASILKGSSNEANASEKQMTIAYDSAYQMLLRYEYDNAIKNATASLNETPSLELKPKFELVLARSLAGLKNIDSSIKITEKIIQNYPGSQEQRYAQDFLGYLKNTNFAIKDADSNTSNKKDKVKRDPNAVYTYDMNEEHLLLIYLTKIDGNTLALKAGFSDYNVMKHSAKKLKTNMNLITSTTGAMTIVEFKNADKAARFAKQVKREPKLFSQVNSNDYKIMTVSKSNFKELLKTRKVAEYLKFYKRNY
jgi:tetratricopeptide (TPR) repeat protein